MDIETIKDHNYDVIEKISQYWSGNVYLVKNTNNNNYYVIKVMDINIDNKQEIDLLEKFKEQHPNLDQIYDWFKDNEKYFLVMEYIPGAVTLDELRYKTIPCINSIMLGLIEALKYLHDQEIVHRDITPYNILVDTNCNPVLIDFGRSCVLNCRMEIGTNPLYIYDPPEILDPDRDQYKGDIYSLGRTLKRSILYSQHQEYEEVIDLMISINPDKRPTLDDLEKWFLEFENSYQNWSIKYKMKLDNIDYMKLLGSIWIFEIRFKGTC